MDRTTVACQSRHTNLCQPKHMGQRKGYFPGMSEGPGAAPIAQAIPSLHGSLKVAVHGHDLQVAWPCWVPLNAPIRSPSHPSSDHRQSKTMKASNFCVVDR